MNEEVKVRGYIVAKSAAYLRAMVGESDARRIFEGLSPQLSAALGQAKPADWMPAAHVSEVLRTVAAQAKGNDERAREELIKCGRYIADEATNTFLKLLMRVLTPALFAKKLPSFWSRDSTHGKYEVDVTADKITCNLKGMEVYEHIAPISVGYVSFALEAMGKTITKSELHGYSLANPSPSEPSFTLYWAR